MFGFNFIRYKNANVGMLRKFVREHKMKSKIVSEKPKTPKKKK